MPTEAGVIDLSDIVEIVDRQYSNEGDGIYEPGCDFGQKGYVALDDIVSVVDNMYLEMIIEEYM